MKKLIIALSVCPVFLFGCSEPKSAEEKIQSAVSEKVHALNPDERMLAMANARSYWEKTWPIYDNQRGMVTNCRPSDSNFNGLVSCTGMEPRANGFTETKMYCGYTKDLVGCNDQDTAPQ